jgi:hypothetical protein
MRQKPADSIDGHYTNKQVVESTAVEIQCDRGILYVYGHDGTPLLKITGLPKPIPDVSDGQHYTRQLTIDIREHGAVCNWGPTPTVVTGNNPIPHPLEDDPWRSDRHDTVAILQVAGATIVEGHPEGKRALHDTGNSGREF